MGKKARLRIPDTPSGAATNTLLSQKLCYLFRGQEMRVRIEIELKI